MASASHKAGNAAEIDRLALALAKEPGSKAFIPLAEEYGKAGMWQEAAAVLEDGLKTYPNFITAMVALGRTYDQLNQPVKAKALLEEAVKLSPENLRAHRTLAKIYAAQGLKEAALRSCAVILNVNPQDQEALSLRASLGTVTDTASPEPSHTSGPRMTATPVAEETKSVAPFKLAQAELEQEENAAAPSRVVQEGLSEPTPTNTLAGGRREATVAKLERWLASVQARRRDGRQSHDSATPTS